jgi:phospholipid/cholesterol/gamma-HCH transport system ATP-binding protein
MTDAAPLRFENVSLEGLGQDGLTLTIEPHSATSIIGRATTGVNSLGAIALGLVTPIRGRALLYGQVVAEMRRREALAFRRKVGYLPAGDGMLQNLSLGDNVALPLRFGSQFSEREIASRVGLMLSIFGIEDAAQLRPAMATEEQRRRTALARALAFDPPFVILEQFFDGLTPRAGALLLDLALGGISAEGSRRALLITGQYLPERHRARIEHCYRIADGLLSPDE